MNVWQYKFRAVQKPLQHQTLSPSGYCAPWGGVARILSWFVVGRRHWGDRWAVHLPSSSQGKCQLIHPALHPILQKYDQIEGRKADTTRKSACAVEAAAFDMHFDFRGREQGESDLKSLSLSNSVKPRVNGIHPICFAYSSRAICPSTSLHSADRQTWEMGWD